jgi:MFS family permease
MVAVLALGVGFLTFAEIHAAVMGTVIGILIALLYSKKSLTSAIGTFAFLTGFVLGAFAVGPTVGLAWAGFWHPWYILFPITIVSFLLGEYFDND